MATYTPAEIVAKTGFSLDTLRYYEKIGLLRGIRRDAAGRRVFTDDDLSWLDILRCLRNTGMPIQQMQRYTNLTLQNGSVAERLEILTEHERAITEQLSQLREYRQHLRDKIAYYRSVHAQQASG